MATKLTDADLLKAAQDLGCEVAVIRAVDEVESNGQGFDSSGNLTIRFEPAIYKRYTGKTIVGNGLLAYNLAVSQNAEAAMLSTSWGRYQIMGFNYTVCGFTSVDAFVSDLKKGEARHLAAFVAFCKKTIYKNLALAVYLQRLDFDSFKLGYNGTGANNYAAKLRTAYLKFHPAGVPVPAIITQKKKAISPPVCSGLCVSPCSAVASTSTTPTNGDPSGS